MVSTTTATSSPPSLTYPAKEHVSSCLGISAPLSHTDMGYDRTKFQQRKPTKKMLLLTWDIESDSRTLPQDFRRNRQICYSVLWSSMLSRFFFFFFLYFSVFSPLSKWMGAVQPGQVHPLGAQTSVGEIKVSNPPPKSQGCPFHGRKRRRASVLSFFVRFWWMICCFPGKGGGANGKKHNKRKMKTKQKKKSLCGTFGLGWTISVWIYNQMWKNEKTN